jgi:hypothetical protein
MIRPVRPAAVLWAAFHDASWLRRVVAVVRSLFLMLTGQLALVSDEPPSRQRTPRRIVVRYVSPRRETLYGVLQALRSPPRMLPA